MKPGVRAVGVAESYAGEDSTLAAAVTRADRTVEGFSFATCTVGGRDATASIGDLLEDAAREDVRYVLVAGIAPAWYNVVDLRALGERIDRPILSVSFEESDGLEAGLREAFDGDALEERLATYRNQPPRERLRVNDETVFVRAVGIESGEARDVVRAFTPEGGRPEPLRVARLAARAADRFRNQGDS